MCINLLERVVVEDGCKIIGWRDVTYNRDAAGKLAREACPDIIQVFLGNPGLSPMDFERKLYLIRRLAEKSIAASGINGSDLFYISSLSARTIVYKGMLMAHQVKAFYPDLEDEDMVSAIAVVHQRYSTNTFPSWPLAQPFRILAHNGEINTLRGNLNKMMAREPVMVSDVWGADIDKLLPVIRNEFGSDSACFDNVLELLYLSDRSLAHAILMMIPEAWGEKYYMGHDRRGFYEYHANFMEPWDGPAAIAFTDGIQVGAILDRNGLRPARYLMTKDNRFILGSECGVIDVPPSDVQAKGRLQPGKMVLVDTERQRVMYNDEIKADVCRRRPYRRWVSANRIEVKNFGAVSETRNEPEEPLARQIAFGYSREDIEVLLLPMARDGHEPLGSMGNDAPLAVLSDRPQLLFDYFKQCFAQVTNPPVDPIREELVMSLTTFLGREGSILEETPGHARRLKLPSPILTNDNMNRIRNSKVEDLRGITLDTTFEAAKGARALETELHRLCREAEKHVLGGCAVIILSDRAVVNRNSQESHYKLWHQHGAVPP